MQCIMHFGWKDGTHPREIVHAAGGSASDVLVKETIFPGLDNYEALIQCPVSQDSPLRGLGE